HAVHVGILLRGEPGAVDVGVAALTGDVGDDAVLDRQGDGVADQAVLVRRPDRAVEDDGAVLALLDRVPGDLAGEHHRHAGLVGRDAAHVDRAVTGAASDVHAVAGRDADLLAG